MCTSPTSTSRRAKASPDEHEKFIVKGVVVVASERGCRHTPLASAVDEKELAPKDVFTVVPDTAKPQTEDGVGARCSTTWSPKTFERLQPAAAAADEEPRRRSERIPTDSSP
jgi:hypothetical protein